MYDNATFDLFTYDGLPPSNNARSLTDKILNGCVSPRLATLARIYNSIRAGSETMSMSETLGKLHNCVKSLSDGTFRTSTLNRLGTFGRTLSDSICGASLLLNSYYDALMYDYFTYDGQYRTAIVTRLYEAGRNLADNIMNGASRLAILSRIHSASTVLADSIMNAASRVAILTKGLFIYLTDTISMSETIDRLGTFARGLSDSIMNAASRLTYISGVNGEHFAIFIDNVMNGASRLVNLDRLASYARDFADTITNSVVVTRFGTFSRSLSDYTMYGVQAMIQSFDNFIYDTFLYDLANLRETIVSSAKVHAHLIRDLSDSVMNGAGRLVEFIINSILSIFTSSLALHKTKR